MEGEDVVSERVLQRWIQNFNTGEENSKDLPRSARPKYYGTKRIYTEFWKEIRKNVLVGCQKNLVYQKIQYIARLRHLENHTEAVDLNLMN